MAKETPLVILCLQFCLIGLCLGNEPVDVESINKKVLELEIEILKLKNEVCGRDQEVQDIATMKETALQMEASVMDLRKEMLELSRLTRMPSVAFRSTLSKSAGTVVPTGTVIAFDVVGLNIGNAYNQYNGMFTAPFNGTYIFSMSLGNPTGKPGVMFMVQSDGNERKVIEFVCAGYNRGWNMGGVSTVTELRVGVTVWVEGESNVGGALSETRLHTSFAGALLTLHESEAKVAKRSSHEL